MRVTIDGAGRLVVPQRLRNEVGLTPGTEAEITVDGAGLRIEPVSGDGFEDDGGFLVIPAAGQVLTDDEVRELRLADQA